MLVIMKKKATENELEQVKQLLVEQDCDFHQSTGANRIILGVVGDTSTLDREQLLQTPGVLDIYHIPDED
jgi:3-deoxy-7-phosphoheptulonate synthase